MWSILSSSDQTACIDPPPNRYLHSAEGGVRFGEPALSSWLPCSVRSSVPLVSIWGWSGALQRTCQAHGPEEEGCSALPHWNSLFPSPHRLVLLQDFTRLKRTLKFPLAAAGKPSRVYKLLEVSGEQFMGL